MKIEKTAPDGSILEVSITDGKWAALYCAVPQGSTHEEVEDFVKMTEEVEKFAQRLGENFCPEKRELLNGLGSLTINGRWYALSLLAMKMCGQLMHTNPIMTDYITSTINDFEFNIKDKDSTKINIIYKVRAVLESFHNHLELCHELGLDDMGTGVYDAMICGYDAEISMRGIRAAREFMEFYNENPYPGNDISKKEKSHYMELYCNRIYRAIWDNLIPQFEPEDEDEDPVDISESYILFDIIGIKVDDDNN